MNGANLRATSISPSTSSLSWAKRSLTGIVPDPKPNISSSSIINVASTLGSSPAKILTFLRSRTALEKYEKII